MNGNDTEEEEEYPACGFSYFYTGDNTDYYVYKQIILGILLPMIGAFGLWANTLVTFVYSRPAMRANAVNVYLCALACSDICTIGSSILLFTTDVFRYRYSRVAWFYGTIIPYLYPLGTTFQTISVYVTLCACMQCYLCVRYTVTRRLYAMPSPNLLIPAIITYGVVWNLSRFFEVSLYVCWESSFNDTSIGVTALPLRYNEWYNLFYYSIGYTVFMCVGPLFTLMYLAAFIVYQTYWGIASHHFAADAEAKGDTINLVMVVVMFILCNSLSVVVNLLELVLMHHPAIKYLIDISNLLVTFNSSVNFLIYHRFSAKFRTILATAMPPKMSSTLNSMIERVAPNRNEHTNSRDKPHWSVETNRYQAANTQGSRRGSTQSQQSPPTLDNHVEAMKKSATNEHWPYSDQQQRNHSLHDHQKPPLEHPKISTILTNGVTRNGKEGRSPPRKRSSSARRHDTPPHCCAQCDVASGGASWWPGSSLSKKRNASTATGSFYNKQTPKPPRRATTLTPSWRRNQDAPLHALVGGGSPVRKRSQVDTQGKSLLRVLPTLHPQSSSTSLHVHSPPCRRQVFLRAGTVEHYVEPSASSVSTGHDLPVVSMSEQRQMGASDNAFHVSKKQVLYTASLPSKMNREYLVIRNRNVPTPCHTPRQLAGRVWRLSGNRHSGRSPSRRRLLPPTSCCSASSTKTGSVQSKARTCPGHVDVTLVCDTDEFLL